MKELTSYFLSKDILFKEIKQIEPKELGSRKKILIYDAIGVDKKYYSIFVVDAKSRFIRKSAEGLIELCNKLIEVKKHNYKYKVLLISSPLCSKAKAFLEENGWRVEIDFM